MSRELCSLMVAEKEVWYFILFEESYRKSTQKPVKDFNSISLQSPAVSKWKISTDDVFFLFFLFKWTLYCSKSSPYGCAWNKSSNHFTDLVILDVGFPFGFSPAVRCVFFPVFFPNHFSHCSKGNTVSPLVVTWWCDCKPWNLTGSFWLDRAWSVKHILWSLGFQTVIQALRVHVHIGVMPAKFSFQTFCIKWFVSDEQGLVSPIPHITFMLQCVHEHCCGARCVNLCFWRFPQFPLFL